jgi:hypothetical protein
LAVVEPSMTGKRSSIMIALRPHTPTTGSLTPTPMAQGTTEYLGHLPDEHFEQAAHTAFAQAPPAQRQGLLRSLLGALQGRGVDLGALQHQLGLPSLSPTQMGPDEYARVANYARRQQPEVMEEQVRSQPWFIKAMGNPIVMGALGVIASKMLRR